MGYSIKDLANAGSKVKEALDERSDQKAQALADKVTNNINQGGGILALLGRIISRWFAFIGSYMLVAAILTRIFSVNELVGMLIAFVAAIFIVRNDAVWNSPFQSAVGFWVGALILFQVF